MPQVPPGGRAWGAFKVKVKVKVGTRLNRVRFVLGRKDALSGSQVVIQEGEPRRPRQAHARGEKC